MARTQPNVMIVLDNSGSMKGLAYPESYKSGTWATTPYYGYFDPSQNYRYDTSSNTASAPNRWIPTAAAMTTGTATNPIASGNFLNWATMKRTDVAKKVLIGGRASTGTTNPNAYNVSYRTTNPVKLYGHPSCQGCGTRTFDATAFPNTLYPPNASPGYYNISLDSNNSMFTMADSSTIVTTRTINPTCPSTVSVPSAWLSGSSASFTQLAACQAVDDVTLSTSDYIKNTTTQDAVVLPFSYAGGTTEGIVSVEVHAVVKVTRQSSSPPTVYLKGVVRMSNDAVATTTTDYASASANINSDTSWADVALPAWSTNPASTLPWTWTDLTTIGVNTMVDFGVSSYTSLSPANPNSSNYASIAQIYLIVRLDTAAGTFNIIADQGSTPASGVLDGMVADASSALSDVRFGLAMYNDSAEGGHIVNPIGFGQVPAMAGSISDMDPSNWTPLGETLYEIMRYFRQDAPYYTTGNTTLCSITRAACTTSNQSTTCPSVHQCTVSSTICTTNADCPTVSSGTGVNTCSSTLVSQTCAGDYVYGTKGLDPYYYLGSTATYVPCTSTFVLFLTDGESTQDQNIPSSVFKKCSLDNSSCTSDSDCHTVNYKCSHDNSACDPGVGCSSYNKTCSFAPNANCDLTACPSISQCLFSHVDCTATGTCATIKQCLVSGADCTSTTCPSRLCATSKADCTSTSCPSRVCNYFPYTSGCTRNSDCPSGSCVSSGSNNCTTYTNTCTTQTNTCTSNTCGGGTGQSCTGQSQTCNIDTSPHPCSKTNIIACSGATPTGATGTVPSTTRYAGTTIGQTYASSGTDYMIDVAFWGRANDMRTHADGTDCAVKPTDWNVPDLCLPKAQNIYLYPIFLFGAGSTLLKDAAIYGGFDDINGNGVPDCIANPAECYRDTDGDGIIRSDGSDDPITYYEGSDGYALEAKVKEALSAIVRRTASGTAASVLASGEGSGANLLQSIFYPRRSISNQPDIYWTSTLLNLWYYLDKGSNNSTVRENTSDTVPGGVMELNLDLDNIVTFIYDAASQTTRAQLFADANADGIADSTTPTAIVDGTDVKYLWEAGTELWNTPATACATGAKPTLTTPCRNIFMNLTDTAATATTAFAGMTPFTTTNLTGTTPTLQSRLNTDFTGAGTGQRSAANNTVVATNIVNYVRGYDQFCSVTKTQPCSGTITCPGTETCGSSINLTSPTETISYRSRTTGIDLLNPATGVRNGTITDTYTIRGETWSEAPKVWKLGDIVNSTQRVVSWIPLNTYHTTYGDTTYSSFISSSTYKNRGMVFAGANDGMLHAFKLGTLDLTVSGNIKAKLCEDDGAGGGIANNGICEPGETNKGNLGKERWAFIPKGVLPYLQYLADPNYCHVYYVDATPYVFDASIEAPGSHTTDYWTQTKTSSSWRTLLIGGMRLGGACKNSASAYEVQTPATDIGYSSYFALDITDPENPQFLWEFSNPNLGYALSGPGVVKINARNSSGSGSTDTSTADKTKDGKWFAVFASGPTGPIGASQFKGQSDQNMRLFVLDLKTGSLLSTIDTGIANAFGGSMTNSSIDYDFDYQDDALYFGYTKSEVATPSSTTVWNKGGVLRLITRANLKGYDVSPTTTAANHGTALNPNNWLVSKVVDDIGAVSASVSHLAHYPLYSMNKPDKAYLYFGTGRFFFPDDDVSSGTPLSPQEALYGMLDPCLSKILDITTDPALSALHSAVCDDSSKVTCTSTLGVKNPPAKDLFDPTSCLEDATTSFPTNAPNGWYITLSAQSGSVGVERVMTDTVASQTGAVFFTSFAPNSDICSQGGATHLWAVKYDTAAAIGGSIKGVGLLQVSTGAIQQIALSSAFGAASDAAHMYGRRTDDIGGVPPTGQGLSIIAPPKPVDTMLHIRKK